MQLDKLQLALRPRPANQALDLGYALLRAHAGTTYAVWLTLWLPLVGLCAALAIWQKDYYWLFLSVAWWLRSFAERAPLYVLSRRVFGENVSWRDALRAWPSQLGGGWFSMLTWRRPIAPARSLYAPIWQLEGARGRVANERRRVIGRNGTSGSAAWFGVCCSFFEIALALGLLGFLSIFMGSENSVNPFMLFVYFVRGQVAGYLQVSLLFLAFAFAGAVIGPVFVAGGFTLYLNRRATLEAWDLEIALRQIKRPKLHGAESGNASVGVLGLLAACVLGLLLVAAPQPADGATAAPISAQPCAAPDWIKKRDATRQPAQDAAQENVRRELAQIYDSDDLRGYSCNKHWVWKGGEPDDAPVRKPTALPDLGFVPDLLKIVVICLLIVGIAWLAYRFRDSFAGLMLPGARRRATEIAGLDIRPESLPDDVPSQVLALWRKGELRQALALLYRATISRLVHDDHLEINVGATEGDCSRLAERAARSNLLSAGRLKATVLATQLWLRAAYADRWPDEAAVAEGCRLWGSEFGLGTGAA